MKTMLNAAAYAAVALFAGVRLFAADGITLSQRITANGNTDTTQVQITKDKMRAEISSAMAGKQVVIFDGTRGVIDILMPERQRYLEITKAEIEQMAQMMNTMMANVPPAARAQMEAMMRGRGMGGATPAAPIEYRKTGADRVGQWNCDKYEGMQNGQKVVELCTVPPGAIGLNADDAAVMQQLAEMFKSFQPMAEQANSLLSVGRVEDQGFAGLPIRQVRTIGNTQMTIEMTGATRGAIPDVQFQVPAGYQKQDMPAMGMGMGMGGGRGRQ